MRHDQPHPQAGKVVRIKTTVPMLGGREFEIEDWWDRVSGRSLWSKIGTPAEMNYLIRVDATLLPKDDEVVYGKVGNFGHILHVEELEL